MNRAEFENYILTTYNAQRDYPWKKYPNFAVFRHSNKKCFAIVMDIQKSKLGLQGNELISVVNLKNSPLMIGSLTDKISIFPAYHMNKQHWVSVLLDGSVADQELQMLLELSINLTSTKKIINKK